MTIRISGLMSGLDTDSMVKDLVKVSSAKVDTLTKAQTKLQWKQDAWEALNTKVNTFFSGNLGTMRFEGSFNKKSTTLSDTTLASVVAGDSAVNGTQTLSVQSLAKAGYLTGGKLTADTDGNAVTGKTTLAKLGISDGSSINVTVAGKTTTLDFNGSTTVNQVVSSLQKAGVEASWDDTNKRLFVNVTDSGVSNDFKLESSNTNGQTLLSKLKLVDSSEADTYKGLTSSDAAYATLLAAEKATLLTSYTNKLSTANTTLTSLNSSLSSLTSDKDTNVSDMQTKYSGSAYLDAADVSGLSTSSGTDSAITKINDAVTARRAELVTANPSITEEEIAADSSMQTLNTTLTDLQTTKGYYTQIDTTNTAITAAQADITNYTNHVNDTGSVLTTEATSVLQAKITAANNGTYADTNDATKAVRVYGSDAQITLNGATFTSDDNSFTVNGLTITALETSAKNTDGTYDSVSLNTAADVTGIYNMVKSYFTEYNSLINEMSSLYNADTSSGYEPLTTDEKSAMSDTEITAWEKKIKDALLRKDENLNSVMGLMKSSMMQSKTIGGTDYNLESFGVETQSYFTAAEDERNAYHIDGDSTDSISSTNTDKLKTAIASDPTSVAKFFSSIASDLYDKLNTTMKSSSNRSIYNIYDDKKMKSDYDDYTDKISTQQDKVDAMEERYYKQFSTMETALSKLQSNSSSLSSLLG